MAQFCTGCDSEYDSCFLKHLRSFLCTVASLILFGEYSKNEHPNQ